MFRSVGTYSQNWTAYLQFIVDDEIVNILTLNTHPKQITI